MGGVFLILHQPPGQRTITFVAFMFFKQQISSY